MAIHLLGRCFRLERRRYFFRVRHNRGEINGNQIEVILVVNLNEDSFFRVESFSFLSSHFSREWDQRSFLQICTCVEYFSKGTNVAPNRYAISSRYISIDISRRLEGQRQFVSVTLVSRRRNSFFLLFPFLSLSFYLYFGLYRIYRSVQKCNR